jgi:uncharacterized membrane protein
MTPDEVASLERAPRYLELVLGVACAAIGLVSLGLLAFALFKWSIAADRSISRHDLAVLLGFCLVGCLLSALGWRLLTGRGRNSDGGLLSPWLLRTGGAFFVVGGVAVAISRWAIFTGLGLAIVGVTCFRLASYRGRHANETVIPDHVA